MRNIYRICAALLSLLFVACTTPGNEEEPAATYLKVTPSEITFDENSDNTFVVDTDGAWEITVSDKVKLSAKSGDAGLSTVRIVEVTSSSTQTIIVRTPSNAKLVGLVKVVPSGSNNDTPDNPTPTTTLYYDNFDGDESYNDWAYNSTVWQNPTGEGAENVAYETNYTKIKNDLYGSTGKYTNASGKCYVNIYKPDNNIAYFEIHNIATNSEKNFTLSFGAIFKSSHCALYIKGDDSEWKRLEYTGATTYNSWAVA